MNYIYPIASKISKVDKAILMQQQAKLIWMTGLSGSGKSTLALQFEYFLFTQKFKTFLLDGDTVRNGLNKDLGFSDDDRKENLRRIAEVSKLMIDSGLIVISAFISPFKAERELIKEIVGAENFVEVFVDCPLEECEKRDVKGLYDKARKGMIKNFTGIDSPYEKPENPDIHLKTNEQDVSSCLDILVQKIVPTLSI